MWFADPNRFKGVLTFACEKEPGLSATPKVTHLSATSSKSSYCMGHIISVKLYGPYNMSFNLMVHSNVLCWRVSVALILVSFSQSWVLNSRSNVMMLQYILRSYRRHDYWTNVLVPHITTGMTAYINRA